MFVGRVLGWIILIFGLVVLGRDLIGWVDSSRFDPIALGQMWSDFDPGSLGTTEALIRDHVPVLWDRAIAPALRCWATPVLILLGGALVLACRRRAPRAARRRRR